jgi:hypothetical protein
MERMAGIAGYAGVGQTMDSLNNGGHVMKGAIGVVIAVLIGVRGLS